MEEDNLKLVHHISVKEPAQQHIDTFRAQLRAPEPRNPFEILMERPACDTPYPCQFQSACYSPGVPDMKSLGIYMPVAV